MSKQKSGEASRMADTILKYRYLVAAVIFVLLVAFKVNGSNIACWGKFVTLSTQSKVLAGEPRDIRSDEWEVLFPIYLSQQNSDTPFSIVNPDITTSGQNVVLTLGAPVKDIYSLAKPLNWGFFFLGADRALSWYWDMKLLLILLLGYELCMILTKENKLVSVLGAFWITLSPAVQWWFAQHMGDMTLAFESMVVTFYYFLKFYDRRPLQIVFAFLFSLSCLGFITPVYPALQIPIGFLTILFMALIFAGFRKQLHFHWKDALVVGGAAVFTLMMLVHLYLILRGAITLMTHTLYPGQRVSTGGGTPDFSFYSFLTNFWLPLPGMTVQITGENPCELSSFYNFLPAVLLALPILIRHRRDSLRYGITLSIFSVFFALYMAFSFMPKSLAKLTLLSYVTGQRAMLVYAFSAMLLSIWALGEFVRSGPVGRIYSALVAVAVGVTYVLTVEYGGIRQSSIRLRYYLLFIAVLTILMYLLLRGRQKIFAVGMAAVILVSGVAVNPINIGTGNLLNNSLSKEIRTIDKSDPNGVWLATDTSSLVSCMLNVLVYVNGAVSEGGINNYPDYAKWALLDPNAQDEYAYNRSMHVAYQLVNQKTTFDLQDTNSLMVNINSKDLKKLDVKYVISAKDLTTFNNGTTQFTRIFSDGKNAYAIYRVAYSK